MNDISFGTLCDGYGVTMTLASKVELPNGRETVLGFFDAVKKLYPRMTDFERRDTDEFSLEEDRDSGSYRTTLIDGRRLVSAFVNPPAVADADEQHQKILEMAPYHLGLHALDTDSLDVTYYFDLDCQGNHDEVVVEALAGGGPFDSLARMPAARVLNFQPNLMLALDDGCQLQARLSVETRTTAFQVRNNTFTDNPITVYFTVRQFWGRQPFNTYNESYLHQRRTLDELTLEYVVPKIITPLKTVIATKL